MLDLHELYSWAFGFLGFFVGSFLNVLIFRLPRGFSIALPRRSTCSSCFSKIKWYQNIPVLSFLWTKGRCKACAAKIGWIHPVVETLTAVFFWVAFSLWGWSFEFFFYGVFLCILLSVTFIDLEHRIIPDELSILGTLFGLVLSFYIPQLGFSASLFGALMGGGSFWLLATLYMKFSGREGLGFGDVKLLAAIGAFLGPKGVMGTILISSVLGTIIGIFIMMKSREGLKTAIPYGPFLALGAMIMLFWSDHLQMFLYPGF